ncbi:T9SS type A sorting domain-containing protein [uncultured Kordia sp.]|uniref:DUF7619 domain-containing protein n=1 Tax=uncultured Kordia sp. TaxID=507699 RepID=UPI002623D49E|nr:T9SS type A sorting domain-containing protein [uncultured Kordia sp.]
MYSQPVTAMKTNILYIVLVFFVFTTTGFSQEVDLGDDIETCEGETITLDATTQDATSYQWSKDGQILVSETNAILLISENGIYEATAVINGMLSSDAIVVTFVAVPVVNNPGVIELESADGGDFEVFNLTATIPVIIGGNTDVQVIFFENLLDATNNTNPVVNPTSYTNISNPQIVHARVEDLITSCVSIASFTLKVLTYIVVDCDQPSIITTYCYTNDDQTEFRFRSSNGSPITLEFLAGTVENSYDEIIIYDSNTNTGTVIYNGYGNNGDVTGLLVESSGDSLLLQLQSDGVTSCDTDNFIPLQFRAYCSASQPAIGIINVRSFLDENANSIHDSGEAFFPFVIVSYEVNNDGITNNGSASYNYTISSQDPTDTYDFTYSLPIDYENCYDVTIPTINDVSVNAGGIENVDFPITVQQACEDVEVILINSVHPPRPGFTYQNRLIIKNNSATTIAAGTVTLDIDDALTFNSTLIINPNYIVTNTATGITIDFVNLSPFDTEIIIVELLCPANVALGEIMTNIFTYTSDTNDFIATNNTFLLSETVVGSWDPNDITESHGPEIIHEDFSSQDYLYYTIRFQNLGTAEAVNVRIEETLDVELDETTFEMITASHYFQVERTASELTWRFNNINLPAEMFDAEGSNGFVFFKIKPKMGYAIGDMIPGEAGIYFDFNAPVITNTFETTFVELLSVAEVDDIHITTYPNPANDILHISFHTNEKAIIELYDVQGKQVLQKNMEGMNVSLKVSKLKSGIYFMKVTTETKQFMKKILIN